MARTKDEPAEDDIEKRLARVAGHAVSLKRMWEEGRECDEMLTQISAVRAGLDQVARLVLDQQVDKCVALAQKPDRAKDAVKDLKKAIKRII